MDLGSQETKTKKPRQLRARTPFESAFDHCSSVLFSLLSNREAANVANALCIPNFLVAKRYEHKYNLRVSAVLAGRYPCVVRNVWFESECDDARMAAKLPSTVTSMLVMDHPSIDLTISDLPRSLTIFSFWRSRAPLSDFLERAQSPEDWPPLLTKLDIRVRNWFDDIVASYLPRALRELDAVCRLHSPFPRSLTSLKTGELTIPISQLPRGLTLLDIHLCEKDLAELEHLPPSLTRFSAQADGTSQGEPVEAKLPAPLRVLQLYDVPQVRPSLPDGIEELNIQNIEADLRVYDQPLRYASLTKMKLIGCKFNQPIHAADLPSLQSVDVDEAFSQPLDDLPLSLTRLALHVRDEKPTPLYAHPLDRLPASLKHLQLHRDYDHPLDRLPPSLRHLHIKGSFSQPLDHLPPSLTQLWWKSSAFNHPLDHLPDSLTELLLGGCFDQPLNHLPASLTELSLFSDSFTHPLDSLPHGLRTLILGLDCHDDPLYSDKLAGIELPKWEFKVPLDHLPDGLQELRMPWHFTLPLDHLPSGLKDLSFSEHSTFNQPLNHLPDSLRMLSLNGTFNQPFSRLPRGLTYLSFFDRASSFNHPLPLVRPSEATSPESGDKDDDKVEATYPTSLRILHLGRSFNQPLTLPPSLTKLEFPPNGAFAQPLPISSLPVTLTQLRLPRLYVFSHPEYVDFAAIRERCPFVAMPREPWNDEDGGDEDDDFAQ